MLVGDPVGVVHTAGKLHHATLKLDGATTSPIMKCGVRGAVGVSFRFETLDYKVGDEIHLDPPLRLAASELDIRSLLDKIPDSKVMAVAEVRRNGKLVRDGVVVEEEEPKDEEPKEPEAPVDTE